MSHHRLASLALTSTSLVALAGGCVAAPSARPVATPTVAVAAAPTTVAAMRRELQPIVQRGELPTSAWADAAHLDVKQVFMLDGKPTIVLGYAGGEMSAGGLRVVDDTGEASVVRALSEAGAADADQLGAVVTIFDQGEHCRTEVVSLQVGAFARFDDEQAHRSGAIWSRASESGSTYLLGELSAVGCLEGVTEAEGVLGEVAGVPLRPASERQRAMVLPALAALPGFVDAQARFDEYQHERGEPTAAWIKEDEVTVQQVIVGRQRYLVASASVSDGDYCGDGFGADVSAVWALEGAGATQALTALDEDAGLGRLTQVALTADGLRVRSAHDVVARVYYAGEYDEGECGC